MNLKNLLPIEIWLRSTAPNVHPKTKNQGKLYNCLLFYIKNFENVYFYYLVKCMVFNVL